MPENNAANEKVRLNRSSTIFIVDYISELEISRDGGSCIHIVITECEIFYIEQEVHPVEKYHFPFKERIRWDLR